MHNSFDANSLKIDVYKSSYLVYGRAGIIDMLSAEGFFFTFRKEGLSTEHSL